MNSPKEILQIWIKNSCSKANLPIYKMIVLGMLAGMYIGLGCHAFILATANGLSVLEKMIGAALFPCGLMLVILCGAELFTGNNLMTLAYMKKEISLAKMLRNWGLVYVANFLGSLIMAFLLAHSGLYDGAPLARAMALASGKIAMPFTQAIIRGILCNILVVLACWMQAASKSMAGKVLGIWFPIALFVFAGFEHSVANMTYVPLGFFLGMEGSWLSFLLHNLLPVTIGNLIGGALVIPVCYILVYKD